MRFTRHARNRLRWAARRHAEVTFEAVTNALRDAETVRYDERGNRRVRIQVGSTGLTVVVDDDSQLSPYGWSER